MFARSRNAVDNHSHLQIDEQMIVCVCNRINCTSVREAVRDGARSPKQVQAAKGCQFNCGKCKLEISELICDEMEKTLSSQTLVAAE